MKATIKDGLISLIAEDLEEASILDTWINEGCGFHVDWNGFRRVLDQLADASEVVQ